MQRAEIIAFILSVHCIGPTAEKARAVAEVQQPKNAVKVRSFLCGVFITHELPDDKPMTYTVLSLFHQPLPSDSFISLFHPLYISGPSLNFSDSDSSSS